jgi:hypothetical protein
LHYNRQKLLDQYGERVVVIYQEKVIGIGDTYQEAIDDAEHNLPPDIGEITPLVELLGYRHPFFRVRPSSPQDLD